MSQNIENLNIPEKLKEIPDSPKKLFIEGSLPDGEFKYLAVVGSRKYTPYGKSACEKIIGELRGQPIIIVSGLALGIDSIAHEEAIKNNLKTIAIPGSGLDKSVLYPKTNYALSRKIINSGGCLISEFEPKFKATTWSFPQRNRIMAGLCDAVLLIEAEEKSGTLITARLAMEYNRDVLVVPGSIFSKNSTGTNRLIKDGAHPVTGSEDVLNILGLDAKTKERDYKDCSDVEKSVLKLLENPKSKEELFNLFDGEISELNMAISLLEIKGYIKESTGEIYRT